ncbi:MAG: T9SS type A sorting domain-containing protein, partial [Bacteroidales bacterium]|nr:T9SS type A sorting domain-containing protein [Bacteroidales bacterium]
NTDFQLPFLGVSSIAIDPENPENIFLGTGDVDSQWTWSSGIYRSKDAGQTWEQAGLNWLTTHFTIGKVLLHPADSDVAFAATSLGVYRTENRNAQNPSWIKVYPAIEEDFEYMRNIAFHPSNPETLFATGIDIVSSCESGNLNTWNRIATSENGLDFTNTPWPNALAGEEYVQSLNMVVAPQGDYLYVNCVSRDNPPPYNWQSASHFHFFSYDIANDQWTGIPTTGLFGGSVGPGITGGRTEMAVSPLNPKVLYCAGVRIYSYNLEFPEVPWQRVLFNAHIDFHELIFSPYEENVLYAGTDGGLFKKDLSFPGTFTDGVADRWKTNQREFYGTFNGNPTIELNNGLGISTIYNFGSSAVDPYQILAGCQDCGIFYHKDNQWKSVINNADGFECLMDHTDINLMYATLPPPANGTIFRSSENCFNPTWEIMMAGSAPINETSWFGAALVADPYDNKTLFQARRNLWKVDDASTATPSDWYKITDINGLIPPGWGNNNCAIWALEIAPTNPGYLYFSGVKLDNWQTEFDAVRLFKTSSGGGTNPDDWNDITPPTPGNPEGTYFISDIAVSSQNPDKIWISYSGYLEDYKIKHFDGTSWSDCHQGLPNLPINCLVYENGSNECLFAGTDVGVYFRDAAMTGWLPFSENLPAVIVNWLEINYTNQKLRAGTFGRGLWESDLPETTTIDKTGYVKANTCATSILIFPNPGRSQFSVIIPEDLEFKEAAMFNTLGKSIEISMTRRSDTRFTLETGTLPGGIYYLQITIHKGTATKKLLVE